jgi:16S rRNA (uracil1498-N3)-methyltransferase
MPLAAEGAPSVVRVADLAGHAGEVVIAGEEAHYLARVVRVRAGEQVGATDGRGTIATLEVLDVGASIRARVLSRSRVERGAWLVEKLGELGAAAFVPVHFARVRWERAEAKRERWDRLAAAALRQSRSAWQLEVRSPLTLADALGSLTGVEALRVCRPDGAPWPGRPPAATPGRCVVAIGPSSGFTDGELKVLSEKGFTAVALARARLRTETAAIAVAALWAAADNA